MGVRGSVGRGGYPAHGALAFCYEFPDQWVHELDSGTGLGSVLLDFVQLHLELASALELKVQLFANFGELVIDQRENFSGLHLGPSRSNSPSKAS